VSDNDLTATRRGKLAQLRAAGPAYPNDFRPSDPAGALQEGHRADSGEVLEAAHRRVRVAGRIMAKRSFGQASFVLLADVSGQIQAYLRKDQLSPDEFALAKSLDLGDLIGVEGELFRTKTGELTVSARRLRLLAKCLHPLPEKWHGLSDVETRYRQRYLDLLANREVREVFVKRALIVGRIRSFLGARGFIEVETPILQAVAGGAAARPFRTHHNALDIDLQLRIAPELFLKRLLVGGFERVFEIGRTFRNEGISTRHNPEFTMLEFYQAYATYEDLIDLTEELLVDLANDIVGSLEIAYGEHRLDLRPPLRRVSLLEETARALGCAPAELRDLEAVRGHAARRKIAVPPGAGAGGIATALFEELVEPGLVQPTFVTQFPTEVSPLARPNRDDPFIVDRFELFVVGREVANGFSELNDPDDQRARFEAQVRSRALGDEEAHAMDEDYVTALEYGMPPAAGEGIGSDRLAMLLTDSQSIRDVIAFPLLRPERAGGA